MVSTIETGRIFQENIYCFSKKELEITCLQKPERLGLRKPYCTCPSRLESFKSLKFQVRILLLSSLYYLPLLIISSTHLSQDTVIINVVRFWSDFSIINERLDYILYIFNVKNVRNLKNINLQAFNEHWSWCWLLTIEHDKWSSYPQGFNNLLDWTTWNC